jgi:hypothetical protein
MAVLGTAEVTFTPRNHCANRPKDLAMSLNVGIQGFRTYLTYIYAFECDRQPAFMTNEPTKVQLQALGRHLENGGFRQSE